MFDVAIIGTGPAGLSAALNLRLHNKKIIWFGSKQLSTKVEKSHLIANYPGSPFIKGSDLNQQFLNQIAEAELEIIDEMVTNITPTKKGFMLLGGNEIYNAKSILLATGTSSGKTLQGEQQLLGRGVSYCATCDGFLYKGKTIAVYCGAKRYEHEVRYLAELAEKVYVFAPYKDADLNLENVEMLPYMIKEISGERKANKITDIKGNEYEIDGVFLLRTSVSPTLLMPGLEMEEAHIVVNRKMETSKDGVYAAGDCTGLPYQIAKAVGEGNVAAHSICEYLDEKEKEN